MAPGACVQARTLPPKPGLLFPATLTVTHNTPFYPFRPVNSSSVVRPSSFDIESPSPAMQAFLLGQVDFDRALSLQQRLVEEAHNRGDGQITLLLCEHPTIITIGRGGSPGDVATQNSLIRSGQIEVRWVNRGGGALLHCPGQLAIYPIVPLRWHRFSVGEFIERLQMGIVESLDDLNVPTTRLANSATRQRPPVATGGGRLRSHGPIGRPRRGRPPLDYLLRRLPKRLPPDGTISAHRPEYEFPGG